MDAAETPTPQASAGSNSTEAVFINQTQELMNINENLLLELDAIRLETILLGAEKTLAITPQTREDVIQRVNTIAKRLAHNLEEAKDAGQRLPVRGALLRYAVAASVVTIIVLVAGEAFNTGGNAADAVLFLPIVGITILVAEGLLRMLGQPALMASARDCVRVFFSPHLLTSDVLVYEQSRLNHRVLHMLLSSLGQSAVSSQHRASSLEFSFAALSSTFDDTIAAHRVTKAQNTALNISMMKKSEAVVELVVENTKLQRQVYDLQRFKDSINSATNNPAALQNAAAMAEITLLRQQAQVERDEASAKVQAANDSMRRAEERISQANAILQQARQQQEQTSVYVKETNEQCAKLKKTMEETEALECERMTKLRLLSEQRYGEGLPELRRLEALEEQSEGDDEGQDGESGGEAKDGDGERSAKGEGSKALVLRHPGTDARSQRSKQGKTADLAMKGRYNSFLPAFRYGDGAPRMASGPRADAALRVRASDYALVWPTDVRGLIDRATDEAKRAGGGGSGRGGGAGGHAAFGRGRRDAGGYGGQGWDGKPGKDGRR